MTIMLTPRSYLFTRRPSLQLSAERKPNNGSSNSERKSAPPATKDMTDTPRMSAEPLTRPTTPSSPVVIPLRGKRETPQNQRPESRTSRHNARKPPSRQERRIRPVHSPDDIPPSVAALLAITNIPPQRLNNSLRKRSGAAPRLTVVDATGDDTDISEKEFSMSLGRSPMDLLLSPPDELEHDDLIDDELGRASMASLRSLSNESMPSLDHSSLSSSSLSTNSLVTPSSRRRKPLPPRRLPSSPSLPGKDSAEDHPLASPSFEMDLDQLDFRVFDRSQGSDEHDTETMLELPPRKSAFKSNLTASLKALRSAARSFSSFTAPITPDDFLTRSIISIDPSVPFTDERMPPRLEDVPTPALRRYLNPTTNAPIEAHMPSTLAQTMSATKCTASIQMQTYKISRTGKGTSPSVISKRTQPTPEEVFADVSAGPVARQRDMRENSDFIRIAVMEMAMRKKGKLDNQKPGRARWALPPRKPASKPYEIRNGVPVRWIPVTL